MRARDSGIEIGLGRPGPLNAIADVAGVRVGVVTLSEGEAGPLVVGEGPVRTGVTARALGGELLLDVLDRFGRRTFRPA